MKCIQLCGRASARILRSFARWSAGSGRTTNITSSWEDYEYYKFGAEILDPEGKKIGILYTAVHETAFKFGADNQITVIPNTPFLWGPDGDNGGTWR
jgi:hypothetical protein